MRIMIFELKDYQREAVVCRQKDGNRSIRKKPKKKKKDEDVRSFPGFGTVKDSTNLNEVPSVDSSKKILHD